ncbi:MAG: hypothetical protein ACFFG0_29610 [Candidatus Thorarchaeota archaeon]
MIYCTQCNKNVETKKMEFNIALAIFLAIFTGGIGLLIYFAIYIDRDKRPRCIHCNSVCYTQKNTQPNSNYQLITTPNPYQNQKTVLVTQQVEEKAKFCYNCGVELNQNEAARFCPLCGTNTE